MADAIAGDVILELERTLHTFPRPRGDESGVVEAHLCAWEIVAPGVTGLRPDLAGLDDSVDEFWVKLGVVWVR